MAWFGTSEYECAECSGNGEVQCSYCDSEGCCTACGGHGLDPELVDVPAYRKACDRMQDQAGASWAWVEGDKWIGRKSNSGSVAIHDFLRASSA